MKIYVFNPDSDLALACNSENYLAPASIRQMMNDLALLPIWYALPGSTVLAPSAYNAHYLKKMQRVFSLPVQLMTEPELPNCLEAQVMPWGWNVALRKHLLKVGLSALSLPTIECLAQYRSLASRERSMEVLNRLVREEREDLCGDSECLSLLTNCKEFVTARSACVLKAPWSGSGKGLNWCKGEFTKSIEGWCERVLKEQGFVLGESLYNKVEDFAMEFYSDGQGEVRFAGYSLFSTNKSGAYTGNLLLPLPAIEERITRYVPLCTLMDVRQRLEALLSEIGGTTYVGYLGVDMMVCRLPNNRCALHPCVEINMRMNMGVVSLLIQERFLSPQSIGRFLIEYNPSNEALQANHRQDMAAHPLVVEQGKMRAGYLPLVPVTPKSHYRAYIWA